MKEERRPIYVNDVPDLKWDKTHADKPIPTYTEMTLSSLENVQVYRYCSLPEVLELFGKKTWTLAHPKMWPDRFEHGVSERLFEGDARLAFTWAHLKCLSLEFSSNALWKTYSGSLGVLRLGIKLRDLVAMLGNASCERKLKLYVTRARYVEDKPFVRAIAAQAKKVLAKQVSRYAVPPLTLKRAGFAYENELRICALSEGAGKPPNTISISNLDVSKFESVLIDPYMSPWQAKEIRWLLQDQLRVPAKVSQSKFDAPVTFA